MAVSQSQPQAKLGIASNLVAQAWGTGAWTRENEGQTGACRRRAEMGLVEPLRVRN